MYSINKTEYGIYIRVAGSVTDEESKNILADIRNIVKGLPASFCVFSDLRKMELLSIAAQTVCIQIQETVIEAGVKRSAVILGDQTVTYQFKRLALQSGIFDLERYIDSSTNSDWEEQGLRWVCEGIDPDAEWRDEIARRRARTRQG